jgi:hypothetical protein
MDKEIWVAAIGAVGTILAALIGTFSGSSSKGGKGSRYLIASAAALVGLLVIVIGVAVVWNVIWPADPIFDNTRFLVDQAQKRGMPYVIESLTSVATIEDNPDGRSREMAVRNVYTLRFRAPVGKSDDTFVEEFTSTVGSIEHWFGTHTEQFKNPTGTKYSVEFEGRVGDVMTIVTGATYTYQLPLPRRETASGLRNLEADEDFWFYPNSADLIETVVIVVQSDSLDLQPLQRGALRITNKQPSYTDDVFRGRTAKSQARQNSLSARWKNVMPAETVGILFTWK